jgi:hypothetical protein
MERAFFARAGIKMEANQPGPKPGGAALDDDPVAQLLLSGRAETFEAAEDQYLDENLPLIYNLLAGPMSNEELLQHPIFQMLYFRSSRGWEDSL